VSPVALLFAALGTFAAYYLFVLVRTALHNRSELKLDRIALSAFTIGFVANFFDTLGIGSFAPTTAALRASRSVSDEQIPGTLNTGYASAALLQSFLFIGSIQVEPVTLITMIMAAVLGAWFGAGLFAKWPRRKIQIGMGMALLIAGCLFTFKNLYGDPVGGTAISLTGFKLVLGILGNFTLGVLMMIGVGLYGPCMLLVTLLGMNPQTAFPIMMGSCAFLMPIAGSRFIKEGAANISVSIVLSLSALPAVFLAYRFFMNLNMATLRWPVAFVVVCAGMMLLWAGIRGTKRTIKADAIDSIGGTV
jgi:uncharacterized membrane protein YfcA